MYELLVWFALIILLLYFISSKGEPDPKIALKSVYFITSSILDSDLDVGLDNGNIIGLKSSSHLDID
jgi:hypothetical protein